MFCPKIKKVLDENFEPEDVQHIVAFVERDFSRKGELSIISIFLSAKKHEKKISDVLAVCEQEWKKNWIYQHYQIKGDPDAPGVLGEKNRASFANICQTLGIPNPIEL